METHDARRAGPNHSHAWRGTWSRPVKIDEDALDEFTVARMTDHNVRGCDDDLDVATTSSGEKITSDEEGHYDVDGVSLHRTEKYTVVVGSDASH